MTLVELLIATVVGGMIIAAGYSLYINYVRQQITQGNTEIANRTANFLINYLRNEIVSAGGGLPETTTGLIGTVTPYKSIKILVNRKMAAANVDVSANSNLHDNQIPLDTVDIFTGCEYVYVSGTSSGIQKLMNINYNTKTIKIRNSEISLVPTTVYPIEFNHIFLHNDTLKINREIDDSFAIGEPLAIGVSQFSIKYDINGSGTYLDTVNSSTLVRRVKIEIEAVHQQGNVPETKRKLETIIGIRRGQI